MNFQNFITKSFCVGEKHCSGTKNLVGDKKYFKKTGREIKLLVGNGVICDRKKSMTVSNNTIKVEGLGDFFKDLGQERTSCIKKNGKNVLKSPS